MSRVATRLSLIPKWTLVRVAIIREKSHVLAAQTAERIVDFGESIVSTVRDDYVAANGCF